MEFKGLVVVRLVRWSEVNFGLLNRVCSRYHILSTAQIFS